MVKRRGWWSYTRAAKCMAYAALLSFRDEDEGMLFLLRYLCKMNRREDREGGYAQL